MTASALLKALPEHYDKLMQCEFVTRDSLPMEWKERTGIYVFYENDIAIYVGRGRNLRERIMQHGRPSVADTPLAFHLTVEELNHVTTYRAGEGRSALKKRDNFKSTFKQMKDRVSAMNIKAIVIEDDNKGILSHTFEAFVACKLQTKYNSFLTT